MIDAWLEFPYEEEPTVYCPKCHEEAEINRYSQIECITCEKCFDMPEPDIDEEDLSYGY